MKSLRAYQTQGRATNNCSHNSGSDCSTNKAVLRGSQDTLRVVRMIAGIFRMREGRLRLIERNTRFQDRRGQAHSRTKEVR